MKFSKRKFCKMSTRTSDTIENLKAKIAQLISFPAHRQRLVVFGETLDILKIIWIKIFCKILAS